MSETATRSPAQPAIVLGLTFLLIGLTFALPFRLVPSGTLGAMADDMSPEVANVYALVAWAGWAHFLFAFRGQGQALSRHPNKARRIFLFFGLVALTALALLGARWAVGPAFFGAVVWVYFMDHFIKAEKSFEGKSRTSESFIVRWLASYQPLMAFTWLSLILLGVGDISGKRWLLWCVSVALATIVLVFGGWKKLSSGDVRGPLLSLFFIAEALVWGTFSDYGGQLFLTGVYVFHIAAGSYFHYLGSYFFAHAKTRDRDAFIAPVAILAVNAAIVLLGYYVAYQPALEWLVPVLGIEWFTLWVAVHLVSSDVFPAVRAERSRS